MDVNLKIVSYFIYTLSICIGFISILYLFYLFRKIGNIKYILIAIYLILLTTNSSLKSLQYTNSIEITKTLECIIFIFLYIAIALFSIYSLERSIPTSNRIKIRIWYLISGFMFIVPFLIAKFFQLRWILLLFILIEIGIGIRAITFNRQFPIIKESILWVISRHLIINLFTLPIQIYSILQDNFELFNQFSFLESLNTYSLRSLVGFVPYIIFIIQDLQSHEEKGVDYLKRLSKQYQLSKREYEVFPLLLESLTNKEIGEKLYISEQTVKSHIKSILKKSNFNNRLDMIKDFNKKGFINLI